MITFKNDGLIEFMLITMFGVSIKEKTNPIGYFGTGLKNAIATFLRNEQTITLYRHGIKHDFYAKSETIRDVEIMTIYMTSPGGDLALPFSSELGKNWKVWQAVREIYCNALDEPGFEMAEGEGYGSEGTTSFTLGGDMVDEVMEDFHTYFLPHDNTDVVGNDEIDITMEAPESKAVYLNGVYALKPYHVPNLTYNIKKNLTLTEDRFIAYEWTAKDVIKDYLKEASIDFLKAFITDAQGSFEGTIDLKGVDENRILTAYEMLEDKKGAHKDAQNIYRRHKTPVRSSSSFSAPKVSNLQKALDWINKLGIEVTLPTLSFKDLVDEDVIYEDGIILDDSVIDEEPLDIATKILYGLAMKEYDIDRNNYNMAEYVIQMLWENK